MAGIGMRPTTCATQLLKRSVSRSMLSTQKLSVDLERPRRGSPARSAGPAARSGSIRDDARLVGHAVGHDLGQLRLRFASLAKAMNFRPASLFGEPFRMTQLSTA